MIDLVPQNLVLRAALKAKRPHLRGKLEHVTFEAGYQFWPSDARIPYALFPLRGIISLQLPVPPAKHVEIALVGREGFAGVPLFFGMERSLMRAVALTAGDAIAMPSAVFQAYLGNTAFRSATTRYVHSFVVMLAEISLCNRVHVIEQVCVGRLLLMQDRTQSSSFQVTQDFFSRFLGVRRASVGRVAVRLQKLGAIQYDRRGRLTILDRTKLEKIACSCYHAIKTDFDELIETQGSR